MSLMPPVVLHMESIIIIMDMCSIQLVASYIPGEPIKAALTVRKCSNSIYNTKLSYNKLL